MHGSGNDSQVLVARRFRCLRFSFDTLLMQWIELLATETDKCPI